MKKVICILLSLCMINVNLMAVNSVLLESGTYVPIRIMETVSSKIKSKKTAVVQPSAIVDSNIYTKDGKLLIKRGTPVMVNAVCMKAKSMGKGGEITITPQSTTAIDGQTITLQGSKTLYGDDCRSEVVTIGCLLGLFVLPIIGFLGFLGTGDNVEVPSDYVLTNSVVNSDYYINME